MSMGPVLIGVALGGGISGFFTFVATGATRFYDEPPLGMIPIAIATAMGGIVGGLLGDAAVNDISNFNVGAGPVFQENLAGAEVAAMTQSGNDIEFTQDHRGNITHAVIAAPALTNV